jgi:hypothetical protein
MYVDKSISALRSTRYINTLTAPKNNLLSALYSSSSFRSYPHLSSRSCVQHSPRSTSDHEWAAADVTTPVHCAAVRVCTIVRQWLGCRPSR